MVRFKFSMLFTIIRFQNSHYILLVLSCVNICLFQSFIYIILLINLTLPSLFVLKLNGMAGGTCERLVFFLLICLAPEDCL